MAIYDDDPLTDPDVHPKANYGGDLSIQNKVDDGYFTDEHEYHLVSPITQNPFMPRWNIQLHRKYSGYHGYWPISTTRLITDLVIKSLIN